MPSARTPPTVTRQAARANHSPRHLRVLTASFRQAFNDSNADVRKAVVFCLVDIYMVLGPQFEAHLGELNASQLRLVRIYINRMNKARSERAVRPHQTL